VEIFQRGFGRPQGLAVDVEGRLFVAEALAGEGGVYCISRDRRTERFVSGPSLVGVALDPADGMVLASNETVYRLRSDVRGRL
jgi:hypothetical protein